MHLLSPEAGSEERGRKERECMRRRCNRQLSRLVCRCAEGVRQTGRWSTQRKLQARRMVVALAGRRIDAPRAAMPRFPLERRSAVRRRIRVQLELLGADVLVSSAACGADLLAQDIAGKLGLRR